MRHRHGVQDEGVTAESLDLEAERREEILMLLECVGLGRPEVERQGEQQALGRRFPTLERSEELLEKNALVRRVLVDEHDPVGVLEEEIRVAKLDERWDGLVLVRSDGVQRAATVPGGVEEGA
jgi:hypothetical protein